MEFLSQTEKKSSWISSENIKTYVQEVICVHNFYKRSWDIEQKSLRKGNNKGFRSPFLSHGNPLLLNRFLYWSVYSILLYQENNDLTVEGIYDRFEVLLWLRRKVLPTRLRYQNRDSLYKRSKWTRDPRTQS